MECPRCNVEMETLEGEDISLQRCAECSGVFIDPGDLNRILLRNGLQVLERLGGKANLEEMAVSCPECSGVDLTVVEGNDKLGLRFETCESCGGIWLDLDVEPDATLQSIAAAAGVYYDRNNSLLWSLTMSPAENLLAANVYPGVLPGLAGQVGVWGVFTRRHEWRLGVVSRHTLGLGVGFGR